MSHASIHDPPEPASWHIRSATPDDAKAIAEIYLSSFEATYDFPLAHGDDEVRAWVRDVLLPGAETWVAVADRSPVGFIALRQASIEQLYVAPRWTGRGIGSRLLATALEHRSGSVSLWTFQVNAGARRFYERHGFRVAEATDGSGNEERQPDVRYVRP